LYANNYRPFNNYNNRFRGYGNRPLGGNRFGVVGGMMYRRNERY
jgi:hypothetical protein